MLSLKYKIHLVAKWENVQNILRFNIELEVTIIIKGLNIYAYIYMFTYIYIHTYQVERRGRRKHLISCS
jgi:hypothetical protein